MRRSVVSILIWFAASSAWAVEPASAVKEAGTKNSVWSFGLNGSSHSLRSESGSDLTGGSVAVQLGRGYIWENWFTDVSLDIISGPYQSPQKNKPKLDYSGTGLTTLFGYTPWGSGLRASGGNYGVALGLSYADIVGRSTEAYNTGTETISDFVMRVTNFSVLPSIFYCWLQKARPDDNKPDNLVTRIEGYFITLSYSTPILASYNTKYTSSLGETDDDRETGRLEGRTLILNITALLGS